MQTIQKQDGQRKKSLFISDNNIMLPQHIIAIGGSVGALNALKTFFDYTPLDNASYVILPHLPATYKSALDIILAKHSKLKIKAAEENEPVQINRVYYPPAGYYLKINDGRFELMERTTHTQNRCIDIFLTSLADNENKKNAIAIILSGTGHDGMRGATAIKNSGGLIIVQSPATCAFDGLPKSIIDSGYADFVLDPADMPIVIQGYVNRHVYDD